jgi:hypothetical protein
MHTPALASQFLACFSKHLRSVVIVFDECVLGLLRALQVSGIITIPWTIHCIHA